MVNLTESEQRRLREIGRALAKQDPALARQLSDSGSLRIGPQRAAIGVLAGSIGALGIGAVFQLPVVCVTGWIGLVLGGVVLFVASGRPPAGPPSPAPR